MINIIFISFLSFFLLVNCQSTEEVARDSDEFNGHEESTSEEWKAGVARVNITPKETMWMAGYASRNRPAEGTLHEIWAKALALEDELGNRGILITSDLVGFTKNSADNIRDTIEQEYGLSRDQILINSSHTHTGPEIDIVKFTWRVEDPDLLQMEKIEEYTSWLENRVVQLAGDALEAMKPARLYADNGVARFAVNRRNNPAATLQQATEIAGPSDHSVPVLKVEELNGALMAVAFGYSCHPTVLSGYEWSGDYVGYAQLELEKNYPGATALFFQGAGGDQNPLPRRTIPLAEQYGKELAFAVERVLKEEMRLLSSKLLTVYSEIDLNFAPLPTKEELLEMADDLSGYHHRWVLYMLDKIDGGEERRTSYPYPVQIWQVGEQMVVALGGEIVVDYAIELKRIFGQDTFVMGYSNDPNMAYIPSARVLREGGYEGELSQRAKGLPAKWDSDVEVRILHEVVRLAEDSGVSLPESTLIGN